MLCINGETFTHMRSHVSKKMKILHRFQVNFKKYLLTENRSLYRNAKEVNVTH